MCVSHSVVSNSFVNLWTIWLTRLLYPWDSPGRKTGVGFHALLQRILLVDKCSSLCLLQWENSIAWGLFYVNFLSTLADWAPGTLRRNQFYKKFWLECSCFFFFLMNFPGGPVIKNPPASAGDAVRYLGQEDPLEKKMATQASILAWNNIMDRGAWWVHGVSKNQIQLSD